MEFVVDDRFVLIYILAALAGASLFTFLLYRKDFFSKEFSSRSWKYILLLSLRFLAVFIIILIIPGLIFKSGIKKIDNPVVIFALDKSSSITSHKDSAELKKNFMDQWNELVDKTGKNYEIKLFTFGNEVKNTESFDRNFDEGESDLGQLFEVLGNKFENRNVGAVVMASDGIFTRGDYPVYPAKQFNVPVYSIGLGDTSIYKDIAIKTIRHNKIVFTKNAFQVQVDLHATKASGKQIRLSAIRNGKTLGNETISITRDKQVQTISFTLEAEESGVQKATFVAETIDGEKNTENNSYTIYYEVLDNKNKTLILADAPHPDLGALKRAIESNDGNEVKIAYTMAAPAAETLKEYSAVIYHGLPSAEFSIDNYRDFCIANSIAQAFVISSTTSISRFNNCNSGLRIENARYGFNEVTPIVNADFGLFSLEQKTKEDISDFPPAMAPFGTYTVNSSYAKSMLYQKIGNVNTLNPLIFVNNDPAGKYVVFCGEGLYKWGIYDQMKHENKQISDNIFQSLVQFLSTKKDTRKFRVYTDKNIYRRSENVLFTSEVYDENNKPVYDASITLRVTNEKKQSRNYTFSKVGDRYELNAGSFEPGDYTYSAQGSFGGKTESAFGKFTVQLINPELINTTADFTLMRDLASKTNGEFFTASQVQSVFDQLATNKKLSSVSYMENSYRNMIDIKWLFLLLVIFMSLEWGLRKFFGKM